MLGLKYKCWPLDSSGMFLIVCVEIPQLTAVRLQSFLFRLFLVTLLTLSLVILFQAYGLATRSPQPDLIVRHRVTSLLPPTTPRNVSL